MSTSTVRNIDVQVEEATPEALKDMGGVLGRIDVEVTRAEFFDAVELRKPVNFISDETTVLSLATVHRRPLEVKWLERHYKHTQTFIPLGGKPFILAMAPPCKEDFPDPATVRAFLFDGSAGITMHVGTWHEFPFAVLDPTDVVVILRSETNRNLKNIEDDEASGEDLDKRQLLRRAGVTMNLHL